MTSPGRGGRPADGGRCPGAPGGPASCRAEISETVPRKELVP